MKLEITKSQQDAARKAEQLIESGIDSWVEAGRIIAEQIDESETFVEIICEKCPTLSESIIWRFYAIGKKQIHPALLLSDAAGPKRLLRLPYSLQEKYSNEPVPLLVKTEKGWETLNVDVRNLTNEQAKQAINGDCIRSPQAQRAWVESQNTKRFNPSAEQDAPWKIVGKRLVVKRDVTLTARELAKILSEMES